MAGNIATSSERRSQFDPTAISEIVARSRAEQGLAPTITDPSVIARLAVLVETALRGARS